MANAEETSTEPRDYIVVKRTGPIECEIKGVAKATNASRAIDHFAKNEGGRWAAIPVRNWGEEERTVEEREPIIRREKIDPTKPGARPAAVAPAEAA